MTLDRFLNGYSVLIPKGTLLIEQDVVVPAGCILKLEPGAKVQLNNGARLVSYAPILADGSESDPVVFSTSDPNGRPGGILVMKTTGRSVFDNVIIEGLSVGVKETRFLKGAVTFYKADVDISNSTFSHAWIPLTPHNSHWYPLQFIKIHRVQSTFSVAR